MIIDAHCHIYPDKIAVKASQATADFYGINAYYDGRISTLLDVGKSAGIDKFIVQSVATAPKQVASINRFIHQTVEENKGTMFGLGTLHPESEDIRGDIEYLVELGLHGVKLHPDIQGFKLDDYRCLKIYEICEEKGLPLLVHTGDSRFDYSNPNRLVPILDIYDRLVIVGAHFGGWSMWEKAALELYEKPNFYVDCSSSFYALSDEQIRKLVSEYGVERVLFGTDYPMWLPETEV
ncbi:MAG: amidohydrolase family protein, partial [Clostridia bacterium]|nr:amidohydrolase family protein [Clostridia bacterium]